MASSNSRKNLARKENEDENSNNKEGGDLDAANTSSAFLIDQIVATDLARQDQKAKLAPSSGLMKKRSPHPRKAQFRERSYDQLMQEKRREAEIRRNLLHKNTGARRESLANTDTSTTTKRKTAYERDTPTNHSNPSNLINEGSKATRSKEHEKQTTTRRPRGPSMAPAIPQESLQLPSRRTVDLSNQMGVRREILEKQHKESKLVEDVQATSNRRVISKEASGVSKSSLVSSTIPEDRQYTKKQQQRIHRSSASGGDDDDDDEQPLQPPPRYNRPQLVAQHHSERTKNSIGSSANGTVLLNEIAKQRERASAIADAVRRKPTSRSRSNDDDNDEKQQARKPASTVARARTTTRQPRDDDDDLKVPFFRDPTTAPVASVEFTASGNDDNDHDYDIDSLSDFEDDNSDDAAYALAMARYSMRSRLEKEKNDDPQQVMKSSRPSLAPAVAASIGIDSTEDDGDGDVEAHAGIPVVLPGAFAVQGPGQGNSASDCSVYSYQSHNDDDAELPSVDVERPRMMDAEICEHYDGQRLPGNEDEIVDEKVTKRFRCMQVFSCVIFVLGLAATTWIGFGFRTPVIALPTVEGWSQIGEDLQGPTSEPQMYFGSAVAVSRRGNRIAVTAPGTDFDEDSNVGQIHIVQERISREVGTTWETRGFVNGPGPSTSEYVSVAMSHDGSILAAGYPGLYTGGQVHMHTETSAGVWEPLWDPIEGETNSWFGYSLALSADGSVLVIGAPLANSTNGESCGSVHVYRRATNGMWLDALSQEITGQAKNEYFGWSVDVSSDGKYFAVGAPVSGDTTGLVRVYAWKGVEWEQIGQDIDGEVVLNRFGESTSLSADGSILAIGARGTAIEKGHAYIYRLVNGQWLRDSAMFSGEELGEAFGASVSLSEDGTVLAVGGPRSSTFGVQSGVARVFSLEDDAWSQVGTSIGFVGGLEVGSALSLANDGKRVVVGAPSTPYDNSIYRAGTAKVFDRIV